MALFGTAVIYGGNYIVARGVMVNGLIGPNAFIGMRAVSAVILFFLFHGIQNPFSGKDHIRLMLCGLTGIAINQLFFFNGLKLSGPIQSALIMTTTPVLVYLLSMIFVGAVWKLHKGIGIICGLFGAILIIIQKNSGHFENALLGNIMIFINALSYAIYLIIAKPLMSKYPPTQVLKFVFLYGLMIVLPFAIPQAGQIDWSRFDRNSILAVCYVILLTTYLAYRFNGFALSKVNSTVVSIYLYLQPLVATIFSVSLGIEKMTLVKSVAAALILVSILLVSTDKLSFWRRFFRP